MPGFGEQSELRKINKAGHSLKKWTGFGFMDSSDEAKENKNSSQDREAKTDDLYIFVKKELHGVRVELQQTKRSVEVLIHGIHGEIKGIVADIKEMKQLTKGNRRMIEKVSRKTSEPITDSSKVSTGLDILIQVPRHLRGTYGTVMKAEHGVTAQDVASRTGKSRPTESDYLNQLTMRGLITKVRSGKRVLFYSGERAGENGNGPDDNDNIVNHTLKKHRMAIRVSDEEET